MPAEIKGNLNPFKGRIASEKIAKNFHKNYKNNKENTKLKQATQQFEALFIKMMLKSMRKTVPKSNLTRQGLEYDIFMGMFDEEVSKKMSERDSIGLSSIIYNAIQKKNQNINSPSLNKNNAPLKLKPEKKLFPINKENKKIKLNNEVKNLIPKRFGSLYEKIDGLNPIIEKAAKKYNVESSLIKAVIAQESSGKQNAVSTSGAKGLMQLKEITAREMGVQQIFNPEENILGGTGYLRKMMDRNNGDLKLALASYNAGPGNVEKYGGIPPFKETNDYIYKVLKYFKIFKQRDDGLKIT